MEKHQLVWGKYECKLENAFQFRGGCCSFSIVRINSGWKIFESPGETPIKQVTFKQTTATIEDGKANVFQTGRSEQLFLLPSLPTKPVVFKTNSQIKISPRQSIKLFLSIPCNVQLYYGQVSPDHLMMEKELVQLSNTWFGETDSGEPAFAIGDSYSLQFDQLEIAENEIICPVKINNNSHQHMELQRFIIHVENLNIYKKSGRMVSDLVSIDFKGPEQISNIIHSTEKIIHGENPVVIAKARNPVSKTILGKSFHFIKHFTQ